MRLYSKFALAVLYMTRALQLPGLEILFFIPHSTFSLRCAR